MTAANLPNLNYELKYHEPYAYYDTGAPRSEDYTTLMIIHGFLWNSGAVISIQAL